MEQVIVPDWLNYGALGVLVLVLFGAYLLGRLILQRLTEAGKFTEQLSQSAIEAMQQIMKESAEVQREAVGAMGQLRTEIEAGRREASNRHERLMADHQEIMRGVQKGKG